MMYFHFLKLNEFHNFITHFKQKISVSRLNRFDLLKLVEINFIIELIPNKLLRNQILLLNILCSSHPMGTGSYIPAGNIGDPFRSVYPPRLFPGSSSTLLPAPPNQHPHQSYLYTPPSRLPAYKSQYPQQPINDYYIGHVLNNTSQTYPSHQNMNYNMGGSESNYTCIGAPVGHGGFGPGSSRSTEGSGRDGSLSNQEEGLNWGRNHAAGGQQQCLDHPSSINRFQDGF
jgi:hypothetical protein